MLRDILFFELHKKIGWTPFLLQPYMYTVFFFNDVVLLDNVFVLLAPLFFSCKVFFAKYFFLFFDYFDVLML
jgi:hypothetical protein